MLTCCDLKRELDSGSRAAGEISQSSAISNAGPLSSTSEHLSRTSTDDTRALRARRASKTIDSLAVLPFDNASRDPEHEYLSDGITASLINILATVPKLRVMAQSTVFRFKGRAIDPQATGRDLNVRAVLTGRVMQSGGSLRIGAELVDVPTGSRLWGAQYDRKSGDIFAIQDDISNEIAEKLKLQLTHAQKKRLTRHHTEDPEAYRIYLKGRHHWNRWTEEGFYKAIEYFQQAIEKDPAYALAHAGVADSYVLLGWNSYLPPKDAFPKAKAAALTALQFDPDLGEAHTPLAAVLWLYDWRWSEAEKEFKRSLELNPTYPTANHWHAESVMTMGRHAEAIAKMKESQALDPLSLIINVAIGWAYYTARRYDEALAQLKQTVELDPNYPVTYWILGLVHRTMGLNASAIAEGEKGVRLSGGSPADARSPRPFLRKSWKKRRSAANPRRPHQPRQVQIRSASFFRRNPHRPRRKRPRPRLPREILRRPLPLAHLPPHRSRHGRLAQRAPFPGFAQARRPSRSVARPVIHDRLAPLLPPIRNLQVAVFKWLVPSFNRGTVY